MVFKIGDKVKHKTGGPEMVVREVDEWVDGENEEVADRLIGCRYYNTISGVFTLDDFYEEELVLVEEPISDDEVDRLSKEQDAKREDLDKVFREIQDHYKKEPPEKYRTNPWPDVPRPYYWEPQDRFYRDPYRITCIAPTPLQASDIPAYLKVK